MNEKFEVIDFHTHPFVNDYYNICQHIPYCNMSCENTVKMMKGLGVSKICGSVISVFQMPANAYRNEWEKISDWNTRALELKKIYGDYYVPGFHVHPDYVDESLAEIDKMAALGVKLVGELVPYMCGKYDYTSQNMRTIVKHATEKGMIISMHTGDSDEMDAFVKANPDATIIAAHPGERASFLRHLDRMKMSENYYLDISATGIFRHGTLRHLLDAAGADKVLYGTDYPTCNPAMFLGAVLLDELISDEERELILAKNAKRLLGL